jgi:hypothetical protein
MSIASSLFQLYIRDAAYFQRMVEFFLHGRFKAVRPFLEGKEREEVFFTVEGELVSVRNNRRRFATFTEWYNDGFGTSCDMNDTDIFNKIWVTRRVTLMDILKTVTAKERDEFLDIKYLSSIAYGYIQRRMRVKFIAVSGVDKKQAVTVEWQGRKYYVSHTNTTTDMGFSVVRFLHTICGEESAIHGLYCIMEDGSKVLLNEEVSAAAVEETNTKPLLPTPPSGSLEVTELKKQMEDLKTHVQLLHTDLRILSPLQIADREKNAKEVEELRAKNAELVAEIEGLKAHQAVLFGHYQHLSAIVGQVMQRVGLYYVPSVGNGQ